MSARWMLCHGRPDRAITIKGYTTPVCARCLAIYAGLIAGVLLELLWIAPSVAIWWLLLLVPMAIDGTRQQLFEYESTTARRLLSGFPAGIGLCMFFRAIAPL